MTYRELYDEVIDSGKYFGPKKKIAALANLIFHFKFDGVETTIPPLVWGLCKKNE